MPRRRSLARRRPPRLKPPVHTPHLMDDIYDYLIGVTDEFPPKRGQSAQSTQVDDTATPPRSATQPST